MARLRYNGLTAELGAALTSSGTTITFAAALTHSGGAAVPTIAGSDYIPLTILDADGNVSEIVYLTAYTASATTGTIARGQEGTTGVAHANGVRLVSGPMVSDFTIAACRVKRVAAHTVANATMTAIPWDGEWYDTDAFHDNSTNPTRLTVPAGLGGLYLMTGVWVPDVAVGSGATRVLCRIQVNGIEVGGSELPGGVISSPTITLEHSLVAGDYVEFSAYQNSGASKATNLANTTFSIRRVGDLP